MTRPKPTVHFVYCKPKWGSTLLRIFQLSEIVAKYLGDECEVRLTRLPRQALPGAQWLWAKAQPNGGVYFFGKACLSRIDPAAFDVIRRKATAICFDHVDGDLRESPIAGCDLHICTSYAQATAVERLTATGAMGAGQPFVLLHNNDTRLPDPPHERLNELRTLYVGLQRNLLLPSEFSGLVDVFDLSDGTPFESILPKFSQYNFHYAVRPPRDPSTEIYKPFLKGFVASKCGANVIAHRETEDVIHFLGDDYPYLVDTVSSDSVGAAFARAQHDFGGADWARALDVVSSMKADVAPQGIANRFLEMIEMLGIVARKAR